MIEGIDVKAIMRSDLEATGIDADQYLTTIKPIEHIRYPKVLMMPGRDTQINDFYCPRNGMWNVLAVLEWEDIKAKACEKEVCIHLNAFGARILKSTDVTHCSIAETFNLRTGDYIEIRAKHNHKSATRIRGRVSYTLLEEKKDEMS